MPRYVYLPTDHPVSGSDDFRVVDPMWLKECVVRPSQVSNGHMVSFDV